MPCTDYTSFIVMSMKFGSEQLFIGTKFLYSFHVDILAGRDQLLRIISKESLILKQWLEGQNIFSYQYQCS